MLLCSVRTAAQLNMLAAPSYEPRQQSTSEFFAIEACKATSDQLLLLLLCSPSPHWMSRTQSGALRLRCLKRCSAGCAWTC
jgi:hypothetical protein